VKFFDRTITYLRKSFQLQFEGRNFTTHHNCLIRQAVKYIVQLIANRMKIIWSLLSNFCDTHFVYLHKVLNPAFPKSSVSG